MPHPTETVCAKCGKQGMGTATDGCVYCHRCVNWKLELQRHREMKAGG